MGENVLELDVKDRKILYELDIDARQSLSQIGKKVGLSKEVVNYRINKLTEDGIIRGFYARVDASKMGLVMFRTFLSLQNITPEKETELINYIISQKQVGWCVKIQGNWDVNFIYWAKSTNHFFNFWKEFKKLYGNYISNRWTSLFGWFINLPKGFLVGKKPESFVPFIMGGSEKIDFDELDVKILSILSEHAREPLISIAQKTGVSDKVVSYRIKNLEKQKVIGGYGVQLDFTKIGYEYWKIHVSLKSYSEQRFNELNNYCIQHPNIVYTDELIGGADLEIEGFFRNSSELQNFMNNMRYKFNDLVRDFEIMLYYKEYKLVFFPWGE
ncbi:MAG: Lrp/AsnC family transcriptional regulator [archaeon]|nr:Lrp/AsnC family transcriptional regulator [archaeon]